jgi:hypothetical protein
MNQFQINREREQLKNLHYWATRAPMSGILIFGVAFFNLAIIITSLCIFSIGISVYIIRSLYHLGKNGWIAAYMVLIGIPFIVCLIPDESGMAVSALLFVPLVLFYFYCFILRYTISEWLSDLGDEKAFELGKTSETTLKGFTDFTEMR